MPPVPATCSGRVRAEEANDNHEKDAAHEPCGVPGGLDDEDAEEAPYQAAEREPQRRPLLVPPCLRQHGAVEPSQAIK